MLFVVVFDFFFLKEEAAIRARVGSGGRGDVKKRQPPRRLQAAEPQMPAQTLAPEPPQAEPVASSVTPMAAPAAASAAPVSYTHLTLPTSDLV